MKIDVVLCLLVTFGAGFSQAANVPDLDGATPLPRIFENQINDTFNLIVGMVAKCDPINIDHKELKFLGFHSQVDKVHAVGFSNIAATHIKLSGLITFTFEMIIEVPSISFSVERWQVNATKLYGDGSARFQMDNFKVSIKAKVVPITKSIKELRITPSVDKAQVSITGIYNDEEQSQKLSDAITKFLNNTINNTKLHDQISKILKGALEKIFGLI